jgi:hypothetical protein
MSHAEILIAGMKRVTTYTYANLHAWMAVWK